MPMEMSINRSTQSSEDIQAVSDILAEGMRLRDLDRTPTQADVVSVEASVASDESNIPFSGVRKRRRTM
jgi:hypothetical protein